MPAHTSALKPRRPYKNSVGKCWNTRRTVRICHTVTSTSLGHLRALQGTRFHSDDEMKEVVQDFPKNQPRSFNSNDIDLLPKRWDLCYKAH
ncbi:hypothetical protein AVEN_81193-1, partial [Araneus ventricosus]